MVDSSNVNIFMESTPNPFYGRDPELSDPRYWSPEDMSFVKHIDLPTKLPRFRSPNITLNGTAKEEAGWLIEAREEGISRREDTFDLLRNFLENLILSGGDDRGVSVSTTDCQATWINEQHFPITRTHSISIDALTVARCTDTFARLDGYREVDAAAEYSPQEIEKIDPLDVASLIAVAQRQMELGIPQPDGGYKAHLIFPTEDFQNLIVLTALVQGKTVIALEFKKQFMPPITIGREIVPLDLSTDWPNNETLQVFLGLIEEGKKLLPLVTFDFSV